ncbi:hypothetical protein [Pseudoalteromonas sp. MMG012]|uniref:hypothetical protein n=1 Tax=Pseudoalteromonas sp. MMG012 TaxID=2822686 RepID=UPI001B39DF2A|nr:hypothetical protein [Pseudoalteromonas sp. MMG012]MBQ4852875.1 hypothetical protein [Pseudoalteromonas sp. MMG012]
MLDGELTEEELEVELERERKILEVELITLEIMCKATIQKAINAAFTHLSAAIRA